MSEYVQIRRSIPNQASRSRGSHSCPSFSHPSLFFLTHLTKALLSPSLKLCTTKNGKNSKKLLVQWFPTDGINNARVYHILWNIRPVNSTHTEINKGVARQKRLRTTVLVYDNNALEFSLIRVR